MDKAEQATDVTPQSADKAGQTLTDDPPPSYYQSTASPYPNASLLCTNPDRLPSSNPPPISPNYQSPSPYPSETIAGHTPPNQSTTSSAPPFRSEHVNLSEPSSPNYYHSTNASAPYPETGNAGSAAYRGVYVSHPQTHLSPSVVVVTQPALPRPHNYRGQLDPQTDAKYAQQALILSLVFTFFATLCCWWVLPCAIPALILACQVKNNPGLDPQSAQSRRGCSVVLSVFGLFFGLAGFLMAIMVGVWVGVSTSQFNSFRENRFG